MQPLISVVIPTFNRSELLNLAIKSVLRQTFEDFEIVVSDNCSTDNTAVMVKAFSDPRVKYFRPPSHCVIAENWEFARKKASGDLIMMLGDDDAVVSSALEVFAEAALAHGSDFLFCRLVEYRDCSFPGAGRNTIACPAFSGQTRLVRTEEFIQPLFDLAPKLPTHPSAFLFSSSLADRVADQCGRFFQTNGVEFFAWPISAAFADTILFIEAPLVILGRTGKSWGANLVLANPGQEKIQQLTSDASQQRVSVPLTNFLMSNLLAEGVLTAQKHFPERLSGYSFDEKNYLRKTFKELQKRDLIGVDVQRDLAELRSYAARFPELQAEFQTSFPGPHQAGRVRRAAERLGVRPRQTVDRIRQNYRVRQGKVSTGFKVSGEDFGFHDILACAQFLDRVLPPPAGPAADTASAPLTAPPMGSHSRSARGRYAG